MKSKHKILMILFAVFICLGFAGKVNAESVNSRDDTDLAYVEHDPEKIDRGADDKISKETQNNEVQPEKEDELTEKTISESTEVAEDTSETNSVKTEEEENKTKDNTKDELKSETKKITNEETTKSTKKEGSESGKYTVDFRYNGSDYVLMGDESVELTKILDKIGIQGKEVKKVTCSNEKLFSAAKVNNEWIVKSHKAFHSDEWMEVNVDGSVYRVKVSDATSFGTNLTWEFAVDTLYIQATSTTNSMPNATATTSLFNGLDTYYVKSVVIGEYVTNIGAYAFYGFPNLAMVTIPDTLSGSSKIGSNAFGNTPNGMHVCYWGPNASDSRLNSACGSLATAFPNCERQKFHYPANYIDPSDTNRKVFYCLENSNQDVYIAGRGITPSWTDGTSPFTSNSAIKTAIKNVTICGEVKALGEYAFMSCSALKDVYFYGQSMQQIKEEAFWCCTELERVRMTDSINDIQKNAFSECHKLVGLSWIDGGEVSFMPYGVTTIGHAAFLRCNAISTLLIYQPTIGAIDQRAFERSSDASGATLIYWGPRASIATLDSKCYEGSALKSFTRYSTTYLNTNIGVHTGDNDSGVTYAIAGKYAFVRGEGEITTTTSIFGSGNNTVENLHISGNITNISKYAFNNGTALENVHIPLGVTTLGGFYNCSSLSSVHVPGSATAIGEYAFYNCNNLTSVEIPSNVVGIGEYAFYNCDNLTSVEIPSNVVGIGAYAFYDCSSLATVTINPGNSLAIGLGSFVFLSSGANIYYNNPESKKSNPEDYLNTSCSSNVADRFGYNIRSNVTWHYNFYFKCGDHLYYNMTDSTSGNVTSTAVTISREPGYTPTGSETAQTAFAMWDYTDGGTTVSPFSRADSTITTVTIDSFVSTIGNYAFLGCSRLSKFGQSSTVGQAYFPSTLYSVGEGAFYGCGSITSVAYASDSPIRAMANLLFYNSGITSLTVPSFIQTIGSYAFGVCSSLTTVTIPNTVTTINNQAFYNCSNLATVTITPNASLTIGTNSFKSLKSGAKIYYNTAYSCRNPVGELAGRCPSSTLSNSFDDGTVYYKCGDNLWFTLSGRTLSIAKTEGYSGTALNMWSWSYQSAQNSPFTNNKSSFDYVSISDAKTIGNYAFYNCTGLKRFASSTNGQVVIPSHISPEGLGMGAFEQCTSITTAIFAGTGSSGITRIPESLFYNATNLANVTIPNTVTYIGQTAFSGTALTSISIPNSVTTIGNSAFYNDSNLATVTITPNASLAIGTNSFKSIKSGAKVYYNTTSACNDPVGELAGRCPSSTLSNSFDTTSTIYYKCGDNLWFTFVNGAVTITKDGASGSSFPMWDWSGSSPSPFTSNASGITSLSINDATTIGNYAFYNCTGITGTLTLPNTVTTIGNYAFYGCTGITGTLTLPNSVTALGSYAFCGCTGITGTLTLSNSLTGTGYRSFQSCSGLTSINIPSSVTILNHSSFKYCSGLTNVTIPSSVVTIEEGVFYNCGNLATVILPSSLANTTSGNTTVYGIGSSVFYGLKNGANIYYNNTESVKANPEGDLASKCYNGDLANSFAANRNYVYHYKCGDNAYYSITNNTVTITGSGTTWDYAQEQRSTEVVPGSGDRWWPLTPFLNRKSEYNSVVFAQDCAVTNVGNIMFKGCTNITSVTFSNSVTAIKDAAFQYVPITSIDLKNIATIANWAFFKTGLTSLTIPNTVTTIGQKVFQGGSSLATVTITPNANLAIGQDSFKGLASSGAKVYYNTAYSCSNPVSDLAGRCPSSTLSNSFDSTSTIYYKCGDNLWFELSGTNNSVATISAYPSDAANKDMWDWYWREVSGQITSPFNKMASTLTTVIMGDVNVIGTYAFFNCTNVTKVLPASYDAASVGVGHAIIPTSVTVIKTSAFEKCNGLTDVTFLHSNNNITLDGSGVFFQCSGLARVTFSSNVTSIGQDMFRLTPDGLKFYCGNAYSKTNLGTLCKDAGGVAQNDIAYSFANHANQYFYFQCGDNLWYELSGTNDSVATISAYPTDAADKTMWDYYGDSPFTQMASSITTVVINDATDVGNYAFYNCVNLTGVTISNTVTEFGRGSFENIGITSLNIPTSVTTIGAYAFYRCGALAEVTIPSGVTGIGQDAFKNLASGANIYYAYTNGRQQVETDFAAICHGGAVTGSFNCGLSAEGGYNFYFKCGGNVYYTLNSSGVLTIVDDPTAAPGSTFAMWYWGAGTGDTGNESNAFYRHSAPGNTGYAAPTITSVIVDSSISYIGNVAFAGCSNITSVVLPDNVTTIGLNSFEGCTSLTSINLSKITSMREYAFRNDSSLEKIDLSSYSDVLKFDTFNGCSSLSEVVLGSSISLIRESAFSGTPDGAKFYCRNAYNKTNLATKCNPPTLDPAVRDNTPFPNSSNQYFYFACGDDLWYEDVGDTGTEVRIFAYPEDTDNKRMWDWDPTAAQDPTTSPFAQMASTLETIDLGPTVHVGNYAFYGCSHIESVSIPRTVHNTYDEEDNCLFGIGYNAFAGLSSGAYIYYDNTEEYKNEPSYQLDAICFSEGGEDKPILNSFGYEVYSSDPGAYVFCFKCGDHLWYSITDEGTDQDSVITAKVFGDGYVPTETGDDTTAKAYTMWSWDAQSYQLTSPFYHYNDAYNPINVVEISDATTIGNYAFYQCDGVESLTIPSTIVNTQDGQGNTVYGIGLEAFTDLASGADIYYNNPESAKADPAGDLESKCYSDGTDTNGRIYNSFGFTVDSTDTGHYIFHFRCGDSAYYSIDGTTVTITGSGATWDYAQEQRSTEVVPGSGDRWWPLTPFCGQSYTTVVFAQDCAVTSVGARMFKACTSITSVTLSNSVTTIKDAAFQYVPITSIDLKNTVTISDWAFCKTSLTSVTIPNSVTTIGARVFSMCSGLVTVTIPSGSNLTTIGQQAFQDSGELVSIMLENCSHLTTIGPRVFNNTVKLESITIPASVTSIGDFAFSGDSALETVTIQSGSNLTTIDVYAFNYCSALTAIDIPNSVTRIGNNAFFKCSSLASVTLPTAQGFTTLEQAVFDGTALVNVNIPSNVTTIGKWAFANCGSLQNVIIPAGVTSIVDGSFEKTADGANFYCGNAYNKTSLGALCKDTSSVSRNSLAYAFPKESVQHFYFQCGDNLWYELSGTNDSVATISAYPSDAANKDMWDWNWHEASGQTTSPFNKMASTLTTVIMGDVNVIGKYAFFNCTNLTKVLPASYDAASVGVGHAIIPTSVTGTKHCSFEKCNSITDVTFLYSNNDITVDNSFFQCSGLARVTFSSNVTSIGQDTFYSTPNGLKFYCGNAYSKENLGTLCKDASGVAQNNIAYSFPNHANQYFYFQCGDNLWYELSGTNDSVATISAYPTDAADKTMWSWDPTAAQDPTTSPFKMIQDNETYPIATVVLGDATTVGNYAFNGCSNIASVTIPSGITAIGNHAFYGLASGADIYYSNPESARSDPEGDLESKCYSDGTDTNGKIYNSFGFTVNSTATGHYIFHFKCGNHLWYTITSEVVEGDTITTATISGDGYVPTETGSDTTYNAYAMWGWTAAVPSPFNRQKNSIDAVVISDATTIGTYAFYQCDLSSGVALPNTLVVIANHAFKWCVLPDSVNIPGSVTTLGLTCFANTTGLTNLTIPSSVTNIDQGAFQGTPNGLKFYCGNAYSKTNLGTYCKNGGVAQNDIAYSFPNHANQYFYFQCGDNLWYELSGTNDSVATISAYPTDAADKTMWSWDPTAAQDPTTSPFKMIQDNETYPIATVVLGDATTVGNYAFNGCSNIASVTIPSGITAIGNHAFYGLASGADIYYSNPESAKCNPAGDLESKCYSDGTDTNGKIYNSFGFTVDSTDTGHYIFHFRCGDNLWFAIDSSSRTLSIAKTDGYSGTDLNMWSWWFRSGQNSPFTNNSSSFDYVSISDAKTIGTYAFYNCTGLKRFASSTDGQVVIPSHISPDGLGTGAFEGCNTYITTAIFADTGSSGITIIPESLFYNATNLANVTIPNTVTSIGRTAFSGTALTSISIPNSVTNISASAFYNNSNLATVTITPNANLTIDGSAFKSIKSGAKVYYNTAYSCNNPVSDLAGRCPSSTLSNSFDTTSTIYYKCGDNLWFAIDSSSRTLSIAKTDGYSGTDLNMWSWNYPSAQNSPFTNNSSSFDYVSISDAKTIGAYAFYNCTGLKRFASSTDGQVVIPSHISPDGLGTGAFEGCDTYITTAIFAGTGSSGITIIPESLFYRDTNLANVTIPSTVTSIGNHAFRDTALTSIAIPNSVTTIGNSAFYNCTSLATVTITPNANLTIVGSAFKGLPCTASTPSVVNVIYAGKQAAFEQDCTTSVVTCFDYAVGASDYLLYHFTQDITYVPNDGTMPVPTVPVEYETNAGISIVLATPTRTNYRFDGWCTDAALQTTPITAFTADNTQFGDKTFYAKWTILTRAIIYYCQGGSIASPSVTEYQPGSGETLVLDKPVRSGYAFCGWHRLVTLTDEDVIGGLDGEKWVDEYLDEATLLFEVGDNTEDVSFYAEWYECIAVNYWDSANDTQQTLSSDYEIVKACESTWGGESGQDYVYVLKDDVSITGPIDVKGNVSLILKDGCSLDVANIMTVNDGEGTLTIYSQQSESTYNAPIDDMQNPQMLFSKYTERTTKQSLTLNEKTYYLDEPTNDDDHFVVAYDKTNGDKYILYYSDSATGNVIFKLNATDDFYITENGNFIYNGVRYDYDETVNTLQNSEDGSYITNMITDPSTVAIITNPSWNVNNTSFCYYTKDGTNYYEGNKHVLINETNNDTPTAYHFDSDTGDTIGYTNSYVRGEITIDLSESTNTSGACIGGETGQVNGDINIHGGRINLKNNGSSACIGSGDCSENSGYQSNTSNINIYGGNITAINYSKEGNSAIIGGGYNSSGGTINVSGGQITVTNKSVTIGAGQAKQGVTPTSGQETSVNLDWHNKTDYVDSQCGGFDDEHTSDYTSITVASEKFIYRRLGEAESTQEGSGTIVTNANLITNNNFKFIPYFEVDYIMVYPTSDIVVPFRPNAAYAFGCDAGQGRKYIGISTRQDDPSTQDVDETSTVVQPYCLSLTLAKSNLKRVKNYVIVEGVKQAVYYQPEEAGYDEIEFDMVKIVSFDPIVTGSSLNQVPMVFSGSGYNYDSGRESDIEGVNDAVALQFANRTSSIKPGIYQGNVNFTAGVGVLEDENINPWYDYYNS